MQETPDDPPDPRRLFLDLEMDGRGGVVSIGAVLGEAEFRRDGRDCGPRGFADLDAFAARATSVAGHNLVGFDLPFVAAARPAARVLTLPAIDTLVLSPLAFPRKPYHALVKDYKLVSDTLNDPVADARTAQRLLSDEDRALRELAGADPVLLDAFRTALDGWDTGTALCPAAARGTSEFVGACGGRRRREDEIVAALRDRLAGRVCATAWSTAARDLLADAASRPSLAYAAVWIANADSRSVLPPWVSRRFAPVAALVRRVRETPCRDAACRWCEEVHSPRVQARTLFGFDGFRGAPVAGDRGDGVPVMLPAQEAVVRLGLAGRPHLAILPTSFGKSFCYQLPALVRYRRTGALTVVVSPLQALMKDQVDVLEARVSGRYAAAIHGMLTPPERADVLSRVRDGDVAILYVAPEQLRNRSFRGAIAMREIASWVFDEAHCLSKWGHDFRTDYHHAARFVREHANEAAGGRIPPVACFTATAKREVRDEIVAYFRAELGQDLAVVELPPDRPELTWSVREVTEEGRFSVLDEELRARLPADGGGKAIAYLGSRKRTEEAAAFLVHRGFPSRAFHAGLEVTEKRAVQDAFKRGEVRVVCATNAFGMGIDEPEVRVVVHADIPGSLENYLQEAGRAGRDGKPAHCVLLWNPADLDRQFGLLARGRLTRRDIAQILGAIRRCRRGGDGDRPVVATPGELLHDDRTDVSFDAGDRDAKTKVFTAVSWLERGGFLLRDENHTRVFQGRPRVKDMAEAEARIAKLGLSPAKRARWIAILSALMQADARDGLDMDEIAAAAGIRDVEQDDDGPAGSGAPAARRRPAAARLLQTLRDMVRQGLLDEGVFLTAFVKKGVAGGSEAALQTADATERAMLSILRAAAPDADAGNRGDGDDERSAARLSIDLRAVNAELLANGHQTVPDTLRPLLFALAQDGRRFDDGQPSIELKHRGGERYDLRLLRSWENLIETSERRRRAAFAVLQTILDRAEGRGEVLAQFGLTDIAKSVAPALHLAASADTSRAEHAAERALLFLHEIRAVTLQNGLALFRQAMGIRLAREAHGRSYSNDDYGVLAEHYEERKLHVHVAGEYAVLGTRSPRAARDLVASYFALPGSDFIARHFAGREEEVGRATSAATYTRIVDDLGNRTQQSVVTAPAQQDILVLAGPGSGKTKVIVHRCAWLLHVERVPARSIIVLCFNRAAAQEIRVRLRALAGDEARGVGVFTYHALALRLTGRTFERNVDVPGAPERVFDGVIEDANALLRGERTAGGLAPDELRDRLLSGIEHILVDEYQDVDAAQYDLISALAGRKGSAGEREERARLLAVGDDDQNVYGFRRADARYLRRFSDDYDAREVFLVDNYRSTAHIVSAANQVIARNAGRMKTEHPIRVAKAMRERGRGGEIARADRLGRGRVQVFDVNGRGGQVATVAAEIERIRGLVAATAWTDFAVLARTNRELEPLRAWCEANDVPVCRRVKSDAQLPLRHVRELALAFDALAARPAGETLTADALGALLGVAPAAPLPRNPWAALVARAVAEWRDELGAGAASPRDFAEFLREILADQRRGSAVGEGLFLGTVHAAKGLEFPHVFVLDGGWDGRRGERGPDVSRDAHVGDATPVAAPDTPATERAAEDPVAEERRLYYVAMTRAKSTLHILRRADVANPFAAELAALAASGDRALRTRIGTLPRHLPPEILTTRYEILALRDVDLGFPGRQPPSSGIHGRIAALTTGAALKLREQDDRIAIVDLAGHRVGVLSADAAFRWRPRLASVASARVFAIVRRTIDLCAEEFRDAMRADEWEVPLVEVTLRG